jgi:hypothetical protein
MRKQFRLAEIALASNLLCCPSLPSMLAKSSRLTEFALLANTVFPEKTELSSEFTETLYFAWSIN